MDDTNPDTYIFECKGQSDAFYSGMAVANVMDNIRSVSVNSWHQTAGL